MLAQPVANQIAERRVVPLPPQRFFQRQQQRRREGEAGTFGAHGLGHIQIDRHRARELGHLGREDERHTGE